MFNSAVSLPPSQPDVTEYNERSMTLKWKAPIDDGGMPITAYNIEAKTTAGGEWQIWECLDTPVTSVTLQRLQKGQEYQFRVIAINKAGRSEHSVASRPKMAKEADCKSHLSSLDIILIFPTQCSPILTPRPSEMSRWTPRTD